ncbi:hypothetical protein DDZ18_09375 [Marinicauda salina]|uniref:MAPEG family protein n=1 Tax=Marinicauda salina TaxID=2135793 RepID=A0A2U2BSC7_9PROT|nr:MAPEG family protein [Marinicauda salina]PWE16915.1 hypothetical protein DDZ18_09375 [Marinicauda salina]
MPVQDSPELFWLVLVTLLTALLWVPYILQLMAQMGPVGALMDAEGLHPHEAKWAQRAKRAHYNAVENLVVFAPLAITVHALGVGDGLTAGAAAVYFFARLAHYLFHVLGLPVVRTLAFLAGWVCQLALAFRLLGWM